MSWRKQGTGIGIAVALTSSLALGGGSAALAQGTGEVASPEAAALDALSLLRGDGTHDSTEESNSYVDSVEGLVVPTGDGGEPLRVAPAQAGSPALDPSGLLLYEQSTSFSYAFSDAALGRTAGYSIMFDATAPSEFRYAIRIGDTDASLELAEDDSVHVLGPDGTMANIVLPPWAVDANGHSVPTSYSVEGNVLVQHVNHAGAAYPVVADPSFGCDALWCTVLLNKSENSDVADNALNAGILCSFTGAFVPICAAMIGLVWAKANEARSYGKCAGIRWWRINGAFMHPVIEHCP
ncbi:MULTISPECIES: hypothetical protein [unclassified Plantibacter]|uniref:hypothetical protein n=1 Tax=unclassified Plantibacter TaxID=2624265 RepID=UPI003D3568AC